MTDATTPPAGLVGPITATLTLDAIRIYSVEQVMADAAAMHRVMEPVRAMHFDGLEIRHVIEGWGKKSRVELRCPATWWQHLKLAVRERWPRIFGRLRVRFDEAVAENGVLVAGLEPVRARHRVIPYHMPISMRSYVSDHRIETEDADEG